jgi:hypothetical protein
MGRQGKEHTCFNAALAKHGLARLTDLTNKAYAHLIPEIGMEVFGV